MNRKYTFESMRTRIQEAKTAEELEYLSDLLDDLVSADLITASKYRDLDFMIDSRFVELIMEGKI